MVIKICKHLIPIIVFHSGSTAFFADYLTDQITDEEPARINEQYWNDILSRGFEDCLRTEISHLAAPVSELLLQYNCCLIHAAAVVFRKKAWLIVAPSGTGKSTQVRLLQKLFPGKFAVLCGDRPGLEFQKSGDIIVHPTPWNGKEDWHGAPATSLGGVILLSRDEKDEVMQVRGIEAGVLIYPAMIQSGFSKESVIKMAELTTIIAEKVPVLRLKDHTIPESTFLLYNAISTLEEKNDSL